MVEAIKFYEYVIETVEKLALSRNVSSEELKKYFVSSDYCIDVIDNLKGINQLFSQYALHAQNRTQRSNIIKFLANFDFLYNVFCGFNPFDFYTKYFKDKEFNEAVKEVVDKLYDETNGLKWDREKAKGEKDSAVREYVTCLYNFSKYLKDNQINTKEAFVQKLKEKYRTKEDLESLINTFRNEIAKKGFGVALTCDFLKEIDVYFDLPKPDVHIKDVMTKLTGKKYADTDNGAYKCINDFLSLVDEIKVKYPDATAYKLDRAIWLCCTGNFFLHKNDNLKSSFINGINTLK